jgi:cytoskeletal protein CcmA (bactofilin family)
MSELLHFNRLGKEGLLTGEVTWIGDSYVGGTIKGNIHVGQGILYIEESGVIEGDLFVTTAIIRGKVSGNIKASDRIVLESPARVKGKILSGKLSVFPGAQLQLEAHIE